MKIIVTRLEYYNSIPNNDSKLLQKYLIISMLKWFCHLCHFFNGVPILLPRVYNFHSLHVYIIILSQPLLLCRLLLLYFSPNYPTQPINYPTQPIYYPTQPIYYPTQSRNTVVGTGHNGAYIIFPPSTLFWPAQIWPRYWRVTLRRYIVSP